MGLAIWLLGKYARRTTWHHVTIASCGQRCYDEPHGLDVRVNCGLKALSCCLALQHIYTIVENQNDEEEKEE